MDMMQVRRQMLMATPHEATASGNPATFVTDGVWPLKSLKVGFEPVQDLHGYDNPWPAGGGVNKWDEEWEAGRYNPSTGEPTTGESGIRSKNFIPVDANKTYYLYCGTAITNDFRILYYDANKNFKFASPWTNRDTVLSFAGASLDTAYIKFYLAGGVYGNIYKNDVAINNPATVTTYAPYSNVCPITGWTGMTVKCTGENLITCNGTSETVNGVTFEHDGNSVHISGANTSGKVVRHTFSTDLVYKQGLVLTGVPGMKPDGLYGTTSAVRPDPGYKNADVVKGKYYDSDIAQLYSWRVYINADYDGTPFTYTPIVANGALYIVDWADEAGTVYGGTLDVVTGELVVDRAFVDPAKWSRFNQNNGYIAYRIDGLPNGISATDAGVKPMSNIISKYGSFNSSNMTQNIIQTPRDRTTVYMALQEDIDPTTVQFGYAIATPITYHLTHQQILSLVGTNTVFSDTNGGCDVIYWVHGR